MRGLDVQMHTKSIEAVRRAADATETPLAIALDTKGPEIRTGRLRGYEQVCQICW